ncbi:MAG: hypothetical protein M1816_007699 [Peltula sp. TS41687]|nr:MAG: hypothetical protein M1816_007699 [Peltula sp. TS41687]
MAGVVTGLLVPRQPELVPRQLAAEAAFGLEALGAPSGMFFAGVHRGAAAKTPDLVRGLRTWFGTRTGDEADGVSKGLPEDAKVREPALRRPIGHASLDAVQPMSTKEEAELLSFQDGVFRWCMRCFSDLYAGYWTPGAPRPNIDDLFDTCTTRLRTKPGRQADTCTQQLNGTL